MSREEVKKFMETVKDDYIPMPNMAQVVLDTAKKATAPRGTERIGITPCLTWDEWHHLIRVLLEYAQDAQDKAETLQTVCTMIEHMEVEH